jgi:hypothetical protein
LGAVGKCLRPMKLRASHFEWAINPYIQNGERSLPLISAHQRFPHCCSCGSRFKSGPVAFCAAPSIRLSALLLESD